MSVQMKSKGLDEPSQSSNKRLLQFAGFLVALLTGVSVFVLLYAAGYRGRGTIAIAFLAGSAVVLAWKKLATTWLTAVPFLALYASTVFVALTFITPGETVDDRLYQAILSEFDQPENRQVQFGQRNIACQVFSGRNAEFDVLQVQSGRSLTQQDVRRGDAVCLVSQALGRELVPLASPLGRVIRVEPGNQVFKIVGVVDIGEVQEKLLVVPKPQSFE